ncbi:MAG: GNAT family N-acetyltransferase [Anaerolineae bacterium]|nr:GNAT family N-acetyltransferase [Anaerolineae bacterium]
MTITYNNRKDIPSEQLHELFVSVGWSDGMENTMMLENFNRPFQNSTLVISAWNNDKLVGCVRVLSDQMFRSVIYDLAVEPEYQKQGIGRELVKKCIETYPKSEWLVEADPKAAGFYEKNGFKYSGGVFLYIPSEWF